MNIDVVTPTYNRDRFLEATLKSVLEQEFAGKLNYLIMDGGSTDQTIPVANNWIRRIEEGANKATLRVETGKDKGMYDAICKGFLQGHGEIMAWINSDDIYLPNAFKAVQQVFEAHPDVDWISGIPALINVHGSVAGVRAGFPFKSQSGIRRGIYNFKNTRKLCPPIQQDCVFWRRSLWNKLDRDFFNRFSGMKYAGDHILWAEFAKHARMYHVECALSCFRVHGGQLTSDISGYATEMGERPPMWRDILASAMLNLRYIAPSIFRRGPLRKIHEGLCARLGSGFISWDAQAGEWTKSA